MLFRSVTYVDGSVSQISGSGLVDLSEEVGTAGSNVEVAVNMSGSGFSDVKGFTLKVGYNPTALAFNSVTNSMLGGTLTANANAGILTITWTGTSKNLSSLTNVFDIKFVYNGGGTTPVTFEPGCQVSNSSLALIPTDYTDGEAQESTGTTDLTIGTVIGTQYNVESVPITLGAIDGGGYLGALTLKIGYDNTKLVFNGITPGTIASGITSSASNGIITINWSKSNNTTDLTGVLMSMLFTYNTTATVPITFEPGCFLNRTNLSNITMNYTDGALMTCNPVITNQPVDDYIAYGDNASFTVTATNPCYYQWQIKTTPSGSWVDLSNDATYSGVTTATLGVAAPGILFPDYEYRCALGPLVNSDPVQIIFNDPIITDQPDDQTVDLGANATFSVTATGVYSYQWYVSLDGGTSWLPQTGAISSSYTFNNAGAADDGRMYKCLLQPNGIYTDEVTLYVNPLLVNVKVLLQGAYNPSTGVMITSLRTKAYFPLSQPYSGAPWNYSGTESVASVPANVVDWVLVDLRTGTAAATQVDRKAAFVLSDGSLVDLDGVSPLAFPDRNLGNYYIVIRHRNHLAIMSAVAVSLSSSSTLYDFTSSLTQAYGIAPMILASDSKAMMIAGDVNSNGTARTSGPASVNDKTILTNYVGTSTLNEYTSYDVWLDGVVRANGPATVNDATRISNFLGLTIYTTKVPN